MAADHRRSDSLTETEIEHDGKRFIVRSALEVIADDRLKERRRSTPGPGLAFDPIGQPLREAGHGKVSDEAPSTATKICAWRISPVLGSITSTVSPA